MKNVQLPVFLRTMNRKKLVTYAILVSVIFLLFGSIGLSVLLNGGSSSSPIVSTKLRAALLTYKRTVIIVGANATPTPRGNGGLPTIGPTRTTSTGGSTPGAGSGTSGGNNTAETSTPTPTSALASTTPTTTPEEDVIFDNMTPTQADSQNLAATENPTPTEEDVIAVDSVTETISPTNTQQLPETGSVQYPIILFISASVFLFISFLF